MHQSLTTDQLTELVELLHQTPACDPCALGVALEGDEVALACRPLTGPTPLHDLAGFTAPDDWVAAGIVMPLDLRAMGPAQAVHVVTRDGHDVGGVRYGDHRLTTLAGGLMPDLCRRILGMPTPPPPCSTASLLAIEWLDAVIARSLERDLGSSLSWAECVRLLPFAVRERPLADAAATVARLFPWAIVRREHIAEPAPDLPPGAAAWLDDGAFARWLLARYPPLDELWADARDLLEPTAARHLDELVHSWADHL